MKAIALAVIAGLVLGTTGYAQDASKNTPSRPGDGRPSAGEPLSIGRSFSGEVFVGEKAPDFGLDDTRGRRTKLSSYRGGWVLLAFADRGEEVVHLKSIQGDLRALEATLVVVCHDKNGSLRHVAERDSVGFAMLADPTGQIAARYGLYDHIMRRTTPGFFVVDRAGVVRLAVLGQGLPAREVAAFARFAIAGH